MTNTKTIVRNAGWSSVENVINLVVALFTSIAIARTLGPSKNGYIVYISYIASVVSNLGGLGLPSTTRKYMAEYIGMGDRGTARYIYLRTLLLQIGLATVATGGLLCWVLGDAHADYKLASALLVLSIWPGMVTGISAQANVAMEDMAANVPGSAISSVVYFLAIAATVVLKWGVVGVGLALFLMRSVDFLVRQFPTMRRVLSWETTHINPPGLHKRMMTFAGHSVIGMLLGMIVWERCEVLLLKNLCADIRQVAFYSVAFSMSNELLMGATIFGAATGATIFAQYGRDKSKLPEMSASIFRYLFLLSIPLHFIFSALAVPLLLLLFGHLYAGAAVVATLAPLLCLPKAFLSPANNILQSHERQIIVNTATVIAGVVDVGVAWALIPAYGAVGACIGSGAAQLTAVGLMWAAGIRLYKIRLPWRMIAKVTLISVVAALTAHFVAANLAPLWAVVCGGSASLIVLISLMYLLRVLEPMDGERLRNVARMLPKLLAAPADRAISLLVRTDYAGGLPADLHE
jgi:O-antigen/teichoic acid export membrane protein